jgi:hypothetical protein
MCVLVPYVRNTKKTQEAAGFSFSEIDIYRIFCRAKVGKNPKKTAVFLATGAYVARYVSLLNGGTTHSAGFI